MLEYQKHQWEAQTLLQITTTKKTPSKSALLQPPTASLSAHAQDNGLSNLGHLARTLSTSCLPNVPTMPTWIQPQAKCSPSRLATEKAMHEQRLFWDSTSFTSSGYVPQPQLAATLVHMHARHVFPEVFGSS